MAYPVYPQNYPQFPAYPQYQPYPAYQQPNTFQSAASPQQPIQQPVQQQTPVQPPVQSSAPISVRGEQQALDWPIAPGNSLTFIDESAGYVYTKTSLNQFDRPQFVKYKLVREDVQQPVDVPQGAANTPVPDYALKSDVEAVKGEIMGEIEEFRARLDGLGLGEKPAGKGKKKEDNSDG